MVNNHLLCSHTCQQIVTLLILHVMSAINQIHSTLWSTPVAYWISLLLSYKVEKKLTMNNVSKNKRKENVKFKTIFFSSLAWENITNRLKMMLAFENWFKKGETTKRSTSCSAQIISTASTKKLFIYCILSWVFQKFILPSSHVIYQSITFFLSRIEQEWTLNFLFFFKLPNS